MALRQIQVEEEPEMEISYVPIQVPATVEDLETDPELPVDFDEKETVSLLEVAADELDVIGQQIACEGICLDTARSVEKHIPGFIRNAGGHGSFTQRPSLEGLTDTVEAVKKRMVEIIKALRESIASFLRRIKEWLQSKLQKEDSMTISSSLEDFFKENRREKAIAYLTSLPDNEEAAAAEIARFVEGDTDKFKMALTDRLATLAKRVGSIEKQMRESPVQYRLARGSISLQDIFTADNDSSITSMLEDVAGAKDIFAKFAGSGDVGSLLKFITTTNSAMDGYSKDFIVNDEEGDAFDNKPNLPLDALYTNIKKVVADSQRVSFKQAVEQTTKTLAELEKATASFAVEDIVAKLPAEVTEQDRNAVTQGLRQYYRLLSKLITDVLRLWKVRLSSISALNAVGGSLIALVKGFEEAIVSVGAPLEESQKEQLTKALVNKGFTITF